MPIAVTQGVAVPYKVCGSCGFKRALSEFHSCASAPDGLQRCCRSCKRELNKARYLRLGKGMYSPWSLISLTMSNRGSSTGGSAMVKALYLAQGGRCAYTGLALDPQLVYEHRHPLAPSLERLDCDRGYEPGNVVLVLRMLNLGRSSYPLEEYLDHLEDLGWVAPGHDARAVVERLRAFTG